MKGLTLGSAGATRVGTPMGADPACLRGKGAYTMRSIVSCCCWLMQEAVFDHVHMHGAKFDRVPIKFMNTLS